MFPREELAAARSGFLPWAGFPPAAAPSVCRVCAGLQWQVHTGPAGHISLQLAQLRWDGPAPFVLDRTSVCWAARSRPSAAQCSGPRQLPQSKVVQGLTMRGNQQPGPAWLASYLTQHENLASRHSVAGPICPMSCRPVQRLGQLLPASGLYLPKAGLYKFGWARRSARSTQRLWRL